MAEAATLTLFAQDVARGSKESRLALAKNLKRAGLWEGEVSGEFTTAYLNALTKLEIKVQEQRKLDIITKSTPTPRLDVLAKLLSSPVTDSGTGSQRVPSRSASYDRPEIGTTQAIANVASQRFRGRDADPAEIKEIHEKYLKFAAKNPTSSSTSMAVTDATGAVVANQSTSVSTGTSESDFISNLMNGSAEAKAYNAASTYLDGMMQEMSRFAGGK